MTHGFGTGVPGAPFNELVAREGLQFGWSVRRSNDGELHVVPEDDIREHNLSLSRPISLGCHCKPFPDPDPKYAHIVIHHSYDGREKLEEGVFCDET